MVKSYLPENKGGNGSTTLKEMIQSVFVEVQRTANENAFAKLSQENR